jgi:hypothetical protein
MLSFFFRLEILFLSSQKVINILLNDFKRSFGTSSKFSLSWDTSMEKPHPFFTSMEGLPLGTPPDARLLLEDRSRVRDKVLTLRSLEVGFLVSFGHHTQ